LNTKSLLKCTSAALHAVAARLSVNTAKALASSAATGSTSALVVAGAIDDSQRLVSGHHLVHRGGVADVEIRPRQADRWPHRRERSDHRPAKLTRGPDDNHRAIVAPVRSRGFSVGTQTHQA
jgi:hypothetical protein